MTLSVVLFWGALLLILYSYVAYPILIWLAARAFGHVRSSLPPTPDSDDDLPAVSLIIAAHNEEDSIEERIQNALRVDYSKDKFEVLIGSDGSADRTNEIVAGFNDERVRLLDFKERGGKASVLNRAVPEAHGDVLVFSDANTEFETGAIRVLVETLQNRKGVIAVCGKLVLTDPDGGTNVDGLYWRYESAIKQAESKLAAVLGANGGIYALRKEYFVPLPAGTIIDDFVEPLLVKIRHGGSIVYEPNAIAHEQTPMQIGDEFSRRARIGAGNYQSLAYLWPMILPTRGWSAIAFVSHKLLRWLTPWFMLTALLTNLLLLSSSFYIAMFLCQLIFYASAFWGSTTRGGGLGKLLRLTTMFISMNAALAVGCLRHYSGRASGVWGRTSRQVDS